MAKTQTDPAPEQATKAPAGATPTGAERRQFVRVQPDAANALAARLASGAEVRLIDLSRGGAQFECDRRFLPNATVSLRLVTKDDVVVVSGRVVRSRIVRLSSGGLGYVVAVAFNELLPTPIEASVVNAPAPAPAPAADVSTAEPAAATAAVPDVPVPADPGPAAAGMPPAYDEPDLPPAIVADISAEEVLAFEATMEMAPAMLTLTAAVDATSEQLRDLFNGNDW